MRRKVAENMASYTLTESGLYVRPEIAATPKAPAAPQITARQMWYLDALRNTREMPMEDYCRIVRLVMGDETCTKAEATEYIHRLKKLPWMEGTKPFMSFREWTEHLERLGL